VSGHPQIAVCEACGEPAFAGEQYCEACGTALPVAARRAAPEPPTVEPAAWASDPWYTATTLTRPGTTPATATAPATTAPGYDLVVPHAPPAGEGNRREVVDGPVAAVTDRGSKHWRNEDAVAVRWIGGTGGGFVMVACDGVSVSQDPHLVSRAAVETAVLVLGGAVAAGADLAHAMVEATAAAQRAASAVPHDPAGELGPGACTFVAVAVRDGEAAFASVGDSRAYWLDAGGAVQIGADDSLAAELVATGRFSHRQAMASPGSHALTKWLGLDSMDAQPTLTHIRLPGPGLVLLATDGLWNYAPDPGDIALLVGPVGSEPPLSLARRLASFAEASGGADNITVAVGPVGLPLDHRPGQEVR
jgi:serine/threonine protein phosphatase PrpC